MVEASQTDLALAEPWCRDAFPLKQRTRAAVDLLVVQNRIWRHGTGPTRHQDWLQARRLPMTHHRMSLQRGLPVPHSGVQRHESAACRRHCADLHEVQAPMFAGRMIPVASAGGRVLPACRRPREARALRSGSPSRTSRLPAPRNPRSAARRPLGAQPSSARAGAAQGVTAAAAAHRPRREASSPSRRPTSTPGLWQLLSCRLCRRLQPSKPPVHWQRPPAVGLASWVNGHQQTSAISGSRARCKLLKPVWQVAAPDHASTSPDSSRACGGW